MISYRIILFCLEFCLCFGFKLLGKGAKHCSTCFVFDFKASKKYVLGREREREKLK